MALYGFDVRPISRLGGDSVAKAASYILREKIYDPYSGKTYYYSHVNDLLYSEVLVPGDAPEELHKLPVLLWEIERSEKRYDARIGRVVRLTLPNDREFTDGERIALARKYVQDTFITQGMCAIMAIHAGLNDDPAKNNPHAHVILTDRPVDTNGFCSKKDRSWNTLKQFQTWRKFWADAQNRAFKEKGMDLRVSHESLEVQGIDREPTVPLGRAATALERKGVQTEYGNRNREIAAKQREQEEERLRRRERHRARQRSR